MEFFCCLCGEKGGRRDLEQYLKNYKQAMNYNGKIENKLKIKRKYFALLKEDRLP